MAGLDTALQDSGRDATNDLASVKTLASPMPWQPFRFCDLPPEIRLLIYEQCLVSTQMICLSNLQARLQHRPERHRHGLSPNILRTCRRLYSESSSVLYGANTFFIDLVASWTCKGGGGLSTSIRQPRICARCSSWNIRTQYRNYVLERSDRIQAWRHPVWNSRVSDVRRLYVSLRSYSFYQWKEVTGTADLIRKGYAPTYNCFHQIQYALPPALRLDLVILHVGRAGLINSEDVKLWCIVKACASMYEIDRYRESWKRQVTTDMQRELHWIVSYAMRSTKTLVVPSSTAALELTAATWTYMVQQAGRARRGLDAPCISTRLSTYFRRSGQLAYATKDRKGPEYYLRPRDKSAMRTHQLARMAELLAIDGNILISVAGAEEQQVGI